jgi:tetratricopeptide (TPR) repeat protein
MKGVFGLARASARVGMLAFWVVLCLSGHWGTSTAEAQAKRATGQAKPAPAQATPAAPSGAPTGTENQAREAFERGRIHYDNGDFARAAGAFEEAYKLSGREGLLYNLYLAYRDANQQEKAAEALRNYLAKVEVIENRAQLESRLKALEAGIAQRKADEAREAEEQKRNEEQRAQHEKELAAQKAAAQSAPADAAAEDKKWWLTPVIVMAAGGALMVGSLPTGLMANSKAKKLEDECPSGKGCDPSLKSTADSGKTLAVVTDVLLFGGLATVAVGGVLMLLKRPKTQRAADDSPRANVSCTRAGCAGTVSMRF